MTKTRIATTMIAVAIASVSLVGCGYSNEDKARCEAAGGTIVAESFTSGEGWDAKNSGSFDYCKSPEGKVLFSYDPEVTEVSSWDFTAKREMFAQCTAAEGRVYKSRTGSKQRRIRWVCVIDGQVANVA